MLSFLAMNENYRAWHKKNRVIYSCLQGIVQDNIERGFVSRWSKDNTIYN